MKIICLLLIFTSCSYKEDPSEDYVLVEFASRLEEEHQKLMPPEKKN